MEDGDCVCVCVCVSVCVRVCVLEGEGGGMVVLMIWRVLNGGW